MANRFLNNITINDSYTFPNADGTADQIIKTDGLGQLNFINQSSLAAGSSESVHILVKNTSGSQIAKGTPVYVKSETGNSGKIEIAPADASDEDKMPALGLLETTLNHNAEGYCVQGGLLGALATATIDGTSTTANHTVYIKAGGGLTMTKPTGANFIQNIAKVARVHASNGSLVVSSILRTNDVPTPLYIDHANQRLGIGTEDPDAKLHIEGDGSIIRLQNNSSDANGTFIDFRDSTGSRTGYVGTTGTSDDMFLLAQGAKPIRFYTDAAERMRIDSSGVTHIMGATASVNNSLQFAYNSTAGSAEISAKSTTGNTQFEFYTSNAGTTSERVRIDSNGNVGINTINPNQKLTIKGDDNYVATEQTSYAWGAANTIGVKLGTSTAGVLDFRRWDGGVTHGTALITQVSSDGGWGLDFRVDNKSTNTAATSSRMFLSTSGEVGIGTTSPNYMLHLGGNTIGAVNGEIAFGSVTNVPSGLIQGYRVDGSYKGELRFSTSTSGGTVTQRMVIDEDGNVGIGETNPAAMLDINDSSNDVNLTAATNFAINTGGLIASRHYKNVNLETPKMEWSIGAGTDLNWKKLATIVINDANYSGFGAEIEITDFSGNYGHATAEFGHVYRGALSIKHREGAGVEPKEGIITIHNDMASHIRIYKIAGSGNSSYEIQAKSPANYRQIYIKLKAAIANQLGSITPHANDTNGSTSGGTAYTPNSYTSDAQFKTGFTTMSANKGVILHELGIGTDDPSQKLHVLGNARVTGAYYDSNNSPGTSGDVLSATATGTEWVAASSGGGGISGTIAAAQVAYGTGTDTIGGHSGLTYNGAGTLTATQIQCTSNLYVASSIYHYGDTNTRIAFGGDQIDLYAGGLKMITCDETFSDEVIINQDSHDIDFRVESNTYTHMLFVDAQENKVGINQSVPAYTLDINGNANIATTLRVGGDINGQAGIEGESLTINTGPSTITGELDKDGSKITNLANPTSAQDAATKAYVDSQSGGGGTTYSINAGAKSGNNVPINLDAASGTDTLINLTQGTGITLTRNSSNQITIEASGGGGGSSTLSGLSDVTISSLQNNDLLMYNGTASEWQNTNLGLTVTPTLSGASTGYATLNYTFTVSNHATYDDPAYYVEVYNTSGSVVVANSAITNNYDGTFTFALPSAAASYTIQVRAQDFGDLQSEIATKTITVSQLSLNYRYFRVTNFTGTAKTSVMIRDFRVYTSAGQSGTQLPPNMTSNTAPTPYVASGQGQFNASYDPYKAFDSSASSQWWNLTGNNTTDYLQIDLGQAYTIKSFRFREGSTDYSWTGCTVQASNTGAFNGEEVEVVLTGLTALYPSYKNAG